MAILTYTQISPTLQTLYKEYTGQTTATNIDFSTMQNVFTTALAREDETLYGLIATVTARDIFAVRPYSRKFKGMVWDAARYGNYLRKFTPIVTDANDTNYEWEISAELQKTTASQDWKSGTSPNRHDVLVTIASGGKSFSRKITIFRDQLNAAFESEAGVANYFSALMTEISNRFEIDLENITRSQLNNAIIALNDAGKTKPTANNCLSKVQVFKALTKYNAETGLSMTAQTIMNPQDFRQFSMWLSAELATLAGMMSNHLSLYHGNVTGKTVERHTDKKDLRIYLNSKFANYFEKIGAELFNPEKVTLGDYEKVDFWMDPQNPMTVKGSATVLSNAGDTTVSIANTTVNNVLGLMTDVDFCGVVPVSQWSAPEPFNARFGFRNTWNHYTFKTPVDYTENALLILLE